MTLKTKFSFFKCAESVGLPWPVVTECYYSGVATMLQLEAEKATKSIAYPNEQLKFVPTIVYNHVCCKRLNIDYDNNLMFFFLGIRSTQTKSFIA